MREEVIGEINRFVEENVGNARSDGGRFFGSPLVGFASAVDPLFTQYKTIIGTFHATPQEVLPEAATVICWILPIDARTRRSNSNESLYPSRLWAETRNNGEMFNSDLRRHMAAWLAAKGAKAVAPQLAAEWRQISDTPVGIASTWSERHATYAAGLGTFSLNDGLITERGIAHRIGSVVTDACLEPTPRRYADHRTNCLFYSRGKCGVCIGRCPIGAITEFGHDKESCSRYVYGTVPEKVGKEYGITATGCGLCQTGVPCEEKIP